MMFGFFPVAAVSRLAAQKNSATNGVIRFIVSENNFILATAAVLNPLALCPRRVA
jgi:hypothetical protein